MGAGRIRHLVDVRTDAEREWSDLFPARCRWPGNSGRMALNPAFDEGIRARRRQGNWLCCVAAACARSRRGKRAAELGVEAWQHSRRLRGRSRTNTRTGVTKGLAISPAALAPRLTGKLGFIGRRIPGVNDFFELTPSIPDRGQDRLCPAFNGLHQQPGASHASPRTFPEHVGCPRRACPDWPPPHNASSASSPPDGTRGKGACCCTGDHLTRRGAPKRQIDHLNPGHPDIVRGSPAPCVVMARVRHPVQCVSARLPPRPRAGKTSSAREWAKNI